LGNTNSGECGCGRFVGQDSAAVGLPIKKTFLTSQQKSIEAFVVGPALTVKSNPHRGNLCLHSLTMTSTSAGPSLLLPRQNICVCFSKYEYFIICFSTFEHFSNFETFLKIQSSLELNKFQICIVFKSEHSKKNYTLLKLG
jgi:hypothetical protein